MGPNFGHALAGFFVAGSLTGFRESISWGCSHFKVQLGKNLLQTFLMIVGYVDLYNMAACFIEARKLKGNRKKITARMM